MNNPVAHLIAHYKGSGRCLNTDLGIYMSSHEALVCKTQTFFAMAHPVRVTDRKEPLQWWGEDSPNAWFILILVGNMREAISFLPKTYPLVCYYKSPRKRRGSIWKCFSRDRLERKINHGTNT